VADILQRIVAVKRREVADLAGRAASLRAACRDAPPPRHFAPVLRRGVREPVRIIAEIKRRSPSAGVMADPFDPPTIARRYAQAGAEAISCLTAREFFGGSLEDLRRVREAVTLPVLRKDFIIADSQVSESRAAGADAILLIAEVLEPAQMADLAGRAAELGMDVLAEAHEEGALESAIACGAALVGVNNRDLRTFEVHLETTERLAPRVRAAARVLVSESGIQSAADVARLLRGGVDAILVGESLLRSGDVAAKLAELRQVPPERK